MAAKILITGANGEIGHALIHALSETGDAELIGIDLNPIDPEVAKRCATTHTATIRDDSLLESLERRGITAIYHLAALLSTSAERKPETAHDVNVNGTLGLLRLARRVAERQGAPVLFLFPSTIAVYGLSSRAAKAESGRVRETEWTWPITMYGINKLYCEQLGAYYSDHYMQLSSETQSPGVDFRSLRFPGLISAFTTPTGGTSDYAPEMIHAAAKGEAYDCFVREDSRIPFMAMPDAIEAIHKLSAAPASGLTRRSYNIGAFAPSAGEIAALVRRAFPEARISYAPDPKRQAIIDSWPSDVDDSAARSDWHWAPAFDLERTFQEYLIPNIRRRYS